MTSHLKRLTQRGLEIRNAPTFMGPHSKYFPYALAVTQGECELPLVTADDDILYPRWWLQELMNGARADEIICYRSHLVAMSGETILPYTDWTPNDVSHVGPRTFATGVMGVLYPVAFLKWLAEMGTEFMKYSPRADDIWLHVQALRDKRVVRQLRHTPVEFPVRLGTQRQALAQANVLDGENDRQVRACYGASEVHTLANDESQLEPRGARIADVG
jgi:hypothetical protein